MPASLAKRQAIRNNPEIPCLALGPGDGARPAAIRNFGAAKYFAILADELGWSDTPVYGTTAYYKTPNLERLAQRGRVLTRAYSASPLCSPTRSALPTGVQGKPQGVPFERASRNWQELNSDVPATGPLGIVRLDLHPQVEPSQIDWIAIRLTDSGKLTLAEF